MNGTAAEMGVINTPILLYGYLEALLVCVWACGCAALRVHVRVEHARGTRSDELPAPTGCRFLPADARSRARRSSQRWSPWPDQPQGRNLTRAQESKGQSSPRSLFGLEGAGVRAEPNGRRRGLHRGPEGPASTSASKGQL